MMSQLAKHQAVQASQIKTAKILAYLRKKSLLKKSGLMIAAPLILTVLYINMCMSDRYATEAMIMIKKNNSTAPVSGLGAALGLGEASASEDERILLAYIHSPDLMTQLDHELQIRQHYSQRGIDLISRLPKNASREQFLRFYRKHVKVRQDGVTGLLSIEVQAFDPEFSLSLAERLLHYAEQFINGINLALANQQVDFMRKEVRRAEEALRREKSSILAFQNENRIFNPEGQIQSLSGIMNTLEGQLVQEEAQLSEFESYLSPTASQILVSKARIKALREEIQRQQKRVVGGDENNLNQLNAEYVNLQLNLEFSTNSYTASLNAFEQARAEASRKLRHMVIVSSPQAAEQAKYPRRMYWTVTWIVSAILLYGILQLLLAIIREHKD